MSSRLVAPLLAAGLLLSTSARADYMDHFVVREDVGLRKAPYIGPGRVLVIPIQVAGHAPLDLEQLRHFFSPDDPNGFVSYYRAASLGRYQPEVEVSPLIEFAQCPLPEDSFPNCAVKRGDIAAFTAGMDMIRDVIRLADEAGVDFSRFDVNGRRGTADGYIDGIVLLANIPFAGIAFPFAYFNRDDNLAGGMGGPLIVDGIKISHVAIAGYGNRFVTIHEFGHVLGLTDLYDESNQYDGLHFSFMGAWSYDAKVPLPDAETRYRLRWANVVQVSGSGRFRIAPAEQTGEVYRLGTGQEYFLVENRGPGANFDGEFTDRGLVVYHVDRTVKLKGEEGRFADRLLDCVNCDPWHPYIRIIQADGRVDLQLNGKPDYANDLFRDGDQVVSAADGEPFSAENIRHSTNYYSGASSGIAVRDVKVLEDGTIEATLEAPETDTCVDPLCESGEGCKPVNCGAPAPTEVPAGCCSAAATPVAPLALFALWGLGRRAASLSRRRGATSS